MFESDWRVLGTSVIGSGHIALDLPCQDSHASRLLDNGALILAVADGAGSAVHAQEGSREVVRSSIDYLSRILNSALPTTIEDCHRVLGDAAVDARNALETLSGERELSSFATTLLLALATDRWLSVIQIGDGAIVCQASSGDLRALTVLGDGEYINEATFVTSSNFMTKAHRSTRSVDGINAIAVLSDGLQLLALRYADNTPHAPFFNPLFEFAANPASSLAELEEFLRSERVCDRTDDDKTLLMAVRDRGSHG